MNELHELDMNNSNVKNLNIVDLPDEILLIIFKKLNINDVFYSLVDVNRRFDRLVVDPLYIRDLDLTDNMMLSSLCNQTSSISMQVLSKTCQKILPHIRHQLHKLTIEEYSMKQVLVGKYPQLHSLSLINFHEETLYEYLTGDSILRDLLTKQITHLNIDIKETTKLLRSDTIGKIFVSILSLCKGLTDLNFCTMFPSRECWTRIKYLPFETWSSTLKILKINVTLFVHCIFLLDERFECLSTLIINVKHVSGSTEKMFERKKLPKLKHFSFTTFDYTWEYDNLVVPMLCRMINLEELNLFLSVKGFDSPYVDGIQLYDQFLIYMTQLKKFTFNIKTVFFNNNVNVEFPSNEDIQCSFIERCYQQVAPYVDIRSMKTTSECHVYSLPYDFEHFINLNNCFQGGIFHKVRYLKMYDEYPFENKLFQLISQDFPFLQFLYIYNHRPQMNKEDLSTLITFPYLTFLDLVEANDDYVELFLLKKKIHLPRLLNLCIEYECLERITNNFTNDTKHFNFGTLKNLDTRSSPDRVENLRQYFPLL